MTFFECASSVFLKTNENNSFSISTPGHRNSEDGEELITMLNRLLELRSKKDIELHLKEIEKRGTQIEVENRDYNLAAFDHLKSQILVGLKRVKDRDLEDMV